MKRASEGMAIVLIITICTAFAPVARAAHATNFLDVLYSEVTNRVANPGTNSARQNAALRAASHVLGRNTKTLSADVSALATASTVLNARFGGDATLLSLEENALAAYANEAFAKLDGAKVRLEGFSNDVPRRVLIQFMQATNAFNRYQANSNGLPQRARSLAQVFNKARIPLIKIFQKFPQPAGQSPLAIQTGSNIHMEGPGAHLIFDFHTIDFVGGPRHLTYLCNNDNVLAEEGAGSGDFWQYTKTGDKTATLRAVPTFPSGLGAHDFTLTFTTTTIGTFTGTDFNGQPIQGTFFID